MKARTTFNNQTCDQKDNVLSGVTLSVKEFKFKHSNRVSNSTVSVSLQFFVRNFKLSYAQVSWYFSSAHLVLITFYDHKSKEYGFCKTKMLSDDIVQVLTSGRSLQENMPTYQTTSPVKKKNKNQIIKTVRGDSSFFSFLFFYSFQKFQIQKLIRRKYLYSLPQFEKNL